MQLTETQIRNLPASTLASIRSISEGKGPTPLSLSVNRDVAAENPSLKFSDSNSILLRMEDLLASRTLTPGNFATGGALVGTQVSEIEGVLRPASAVVASGARIITGLSQNYSIGKEAAPITFSWLNALDNRPEADSNWAQINLTPHRLSGATALSNQFKTQTGPDVADFLIESIKLGIGVALDLAAITGDGSFGQPLGILNTTGVQTVTFGGAPTWAKATSFEKLVTAANADETRLGWIGNPDVRDKWRNIQRFSGGSKTLWADDNTVAGHPARGSTNVPTGTIVLGQWEKVLIGIFGKGAPVEILVDPFTRDSKGEIIFSATLYADVCCLQPTAFCKSADSAIQ